MKKDFNEYRFKGLNHREYSNKYMTMDRVSEDKKKIVVKVGEDHLLQTRFGYALILDDKHVVFLKDWAVDSNYYGSEVLLDQNFFNVKEWGNFPDFECNDQNLDWNHWLEVAEAQAAYKFADGTPNMVHWRI